MSVLPSGQLNYSAGRFLLVSNKLQFGIGTRRASSRCR